MTRKDTRNASALRGIAPFIAVLTVMIALAALAQTKGAGQPFVKPVTSPSPNGSVPSDPGPGEAVSPLFLSAVVYDSGGFDGSTSVVVADVNGDHKPDVLVADLCLSSDDCSVGAVGLLLGNGDGTFQAVTTYSSGGTRAVSLAVGDVNGDGKLDIAVNCAGIYRGEPILGEGHKPHSLALFNKVMAVNVSGTFNVCRLAAAAMAAGSPDAKRDGERGVIINTTSIAGFDGMAGSVAYDSSKGAIIAMTLPLARELAAVGIRVVSIAPGAFETPMIHTVDPQMQASLKSVIPFPKRFGAPDEFASLVVAIVDNIMMNGSTVRLDAAFHM